MVYFHLVTSIFQECQTKENQTDQELLQSLGKNLHKVHREGIFFQSVMRSFHHLDSPIVLEVLILCQVKRLHTALYELDTNHRREMS